jgi:signal transduction histidine kinase
MHWQTWKHWPPAIFAVIVSSFLVSTAIVQWRIRVLGEVAADVANTTTPSVEHLATARAETRSLRILLTERAVPLDDVGREAASLERSRRTLGQALEEYLMLPVAPHEQDAWEEVFRAHRALDDAVARFELENSRGDLLAARSTLNGDVRPVAARLDDAITHALDFNLKRSHHLTHDIDQLRARGLAIAIGLDIICTSIAFAGAMLLRRIVREHESLLERHLAMQKGRAVELEQFAGRVAHDILGPLSTVGFALQLVTEPGTRDRAKLTERGFAALLRVKTIVTGLLDFARAGAKPAGDVRTAVASVMSDLAKELVPTAKNLGVELTMTEEGACEVECNPGVLTSLIANLTRNAIKYIGDGPVRRVDVRAFERGPCLRVEVHDTGPGLPPDVEHRVFDAHARARNATQPGIGLGLATVKRLAEAHGGRVGVSSVLGRGCTFWFELPTAGHADAAETVAAHAEGRA